MIHICFCLHDSDGKYSKFVGTTIVSAFEKTFAPITIHILHDSTLTDDNREKFNVLVSHYGQKIQFYNVEELCKAQVTFLRENLADKINLRFSIGTFYRLLIKEILGAQNINKVIYLDADIIVNLDLNELWQKNLQNLPLAAVPEAVATHGNMIEDKFLLKSGLVRTENYFCAGVIVFNLENIDENIFYDGIKFLVDNPQCKSLDQDILNAFFAANYLKLEQKFDSFVLSERRNKFPVENKIYHYAGQCIELNLSDEYNKLFLENFSRTTWFNFEIFGRISDLFQKAIDAYTDLNQWLMKISAQKQRAFFIVPKNIPAIKKLFLIKDDELIIEARDKNSVEELIKNMTEQRGKTIFFIFIKEYEYFKPTLTDRGFKEFNDFVDGVLFLTSKQSKKNHPEYYFIRAL